MIRKKKITHEKLILEPLNCKKCSSAIKPRQQDIFFYCDTCNTGYELRQQELRPIPVEFKIFRGWKEDITKNLPFWTYQAKLTIHQREAVETTSSLFSGLTRVLMGDFVGLTRKGFLRFYIPAYNFSGDYVKSAGGYLTTHQPPLEDGTPDIFEEVYYDSIDAAGIADFLFLSSEIEKSDIVSRLKYELELYDPRMTVIRFKISNIP